MVGCPIGWKADVGKCATDGWKIKGVFLSSFFSFLNTSIPCADTTIILKNILH